MRILTNLERFPQRWRSSTGTSGTGKTVRSFWGFVWKAGQCDVILIDCDPNLVFKLATIFLPLWFRRKPIVALDLVLRRPTTWRSRAATVLKRILLSRVDHFIHYFRQLDGYQKHFGVGPSRSSYVPFKANIQGRFSYEVNSDGEYVLCFGRSERDYDTFIKAVGQTSVVAAIPVPNFGALRAHGSRFSVPLSSLPSNLRLLEDDGSRASWLRMLERAKIVALPILGGRMAASGIGTYLDAMALGKCVIITEGPGVSDVLTDQALFVAPNDAEQLAKVIVRANTDRELRERVAMCGRRYAESCGTEGDLYQRVAEVIVRWYESQRSNRF